MASGAAKTNQQIKTMKNILIALSLTLGLIAGCCTSNLGTQSSTRVPVKKPGTLLWEFDMGDEVFSSPAIGSDGTVYIGSDANKVCALDGKTGAMKWEFIAKGNVPSSPAIGSDGTVYVGSTDNRVYAFTSSSKGPANGPWPMRGQNAQHISRAPKK